MGKAGFDNKEFESNSMFEKKRLGLQNENKFALEEKTNKEATHARKTEEKAAAEEDKTQEKKAREADNAFMNVLTEDCESKAQLFDQRSKTRSAEITAISEAIEALTTKVTPNWGANRKLADLQLPSTGHWVYIKDDVKMQAPVGRRGAASFL